MDPFSLELIVLIGAIGAAAGFATVYAAACMIHNDVSVHELKAKALKLREEALRARQEADEVRTFVTDIAIPGLNAAAPSQSAGYMPSGSKAGKEKH